MTLLWIIGLLAALWAGVRAVNRRKYALRQPGSVQKTGYVTLGGIAQYVQVRGRDRRNPVLIVLHGGPGNPMAFYTYAWQAALEERYTLVHWDQRGSGSTYFQDPSAPRPTLELLLSDLDELVDTVRAEYGQERVALLGHSWGTFLGTAYAARHPEKLWAYVGVGQFYDIWGSEALAVEEAARRAEAAGKTAAAEGIRRQFRQVREADRVDLRAFMKLRQMTGRFLPQGENTPFRVQLCSPWLTVRDLRWLFLMLFRFGRFIELQQGLYETLFAKEDHPITALSVPVVIVAGDQDWITPYAMARRFFDGLSAPKKTFIPVPGGGHIPFLPEKFTKELLAALAELP